jgi:hypothetical protein
MKSGKLFGVIFGLVLGIFSTNSHADDAPSLKGLDNVFVTVTQPAGAVISDSTLLDISTNAKLKIKEAGVTLTESKDATKAGLDIRIQSIKEITNEWVLVQLFLVEPATTSGRKSNIKTAAITYYDHAFFKSSKISADKEVKEAVMKNLILKFVSQYLTQNSK